MIPWLISHFDTRDHAPYVGFGVKAFIIAGMLGLTACVGLAKYARGHEATNTAGQPLGWRYSYACCSDQDCKPIAAEEIKETPEGYVLVKTGEVVGYQDKRIKDSPDGTFHVCQVAGDFDAGRILCLYAPGRGY